MESLHTIINKKNISAFYLLIIKTQLTWTATLLIQSSFYTWCHSTESYDSTVSYGVYVFKF